MTLLDFIGLIAGIFVVLAFYCVEQSRMRRFALVSNVLFILYAWSLALLPILILHATLLPLNLVRLRQLSGWRARSLDAPINLHRTIELAEADMRIALCGQTRLWTTRY